MECRYAPSAVQLMGHALFSLSLPSLSHWSHPLQPSSVGTLVWICQEHPPPTPGDWRRELCSGPGSCMLPEGWLKCALTRFRPSEMLMMASISSSLCETQRLSECPGVTYPRDSPRLGVGVWGAVPALLSPSEQAWLC